MYLDARTDTYLEELSAANIFIVKVCTTCTRMPDTLCDNPHQARRVLTGMASQARLSAVCELRASSAAWEL